MKVYILSSYIELIHLRKWTKEDFKIHDVYLDGKKARTICKEKNRKATYRTYKIKIKTVKDSEVQPQPKDSKDDHPDILTWNKNGDNNE